MASARVYVHWPEAARCFNLPLVCERGGVSVHMQDILVNVLQLKDSSICSFFY